LRGALREETFRAAEGARRDPRPSASWLGGRMRFRPGATSPRIWSPFWRARWRSMQRSSS